MSSFFKNSMVPKVNILLNNSKHEQKNESALKIGKEIGCSLSSAPSGICTDLFT